MSETVFSFPGKLGDAIHQFPVAYWWARQNDQKFTAWLDEKSCKMLVPLLAAQPCVEKVELKPGIENYSCGGQPWHFGLETSDLIGRLVYHLGMRGFPSQQLTLECLSTCGVPITVDRQELADTSPFAVPDGEKVNRLVIHGQGVCPHTRATPMLWRFLYVVWQELKERFDEIVFVGSEADRGVSLQTYPDGKAFDDGGDFLKLAEYLKASRAVIGAGSSVVALAGALKVPCVRVHDNIANGAPKIIWSNLGDNQLNDTEIGLRTSWPEWRDKWLTASK
jgi:hypothetical protein